MEQDQNYRLELISKYRSQSESLFRYISYFKQKKGLRDLQFYNGESLEKTSVPVPVYDGTLLSFVKEVQRTGLVSRNWVYSYSRYGVKTAEDEHWWIGEADLKDIELLYAILGKYVLGGMTKGSMWLDATESGIFLEVLERLLVVLEVHKGPLA